MNHDIQKKNGYGTVIVRPCSELEKKYDYSCVAMKGEKIIGSSSIYLTQMTPLDNVSLEGKKLMIGECGSTVLSQEHRKGVIAYRLLKKTKKIFQDEYDALISATINPSQYKLRKKIGFEAAKFPQKYYNEGKEHFEKIMKKQGKNFGNEAKFTIFCEDEKIKKHLTDLLDNQKGNV